MEMATSPSPSVLARHETTWQHTLSTADARFIEGLRDIVQADKARGRNYGGLLDAISAHIGQFLELPAQTSPWGPIRCTTPGRDDGLTDPILIYITGPAACDRFEATATTSAEASEIARYISALSVAKCVRAREIHDRLIDVSTKRQELEREKSWLGQPAKLTIDNHVQLLRQYNKTKDVGQQLIGLIADSRAVPVGSLYRQGDYGVSMDD